MTLRERLDAGVPLVFGHRGARAYAPMNTLPSFLLAAEQGADGVELDVWRTRDGQLVVIHDDTVDGTTDGHGAVHDFTLAELKQFDAGAHFDPRFARTPIPTLDEVFAALPADFLINVEIKKVDNLSAQTDGIEALVADCVRRHAAADRVIVSSFSLNALERFHALAPDAAIALGCLFENHADFRHMRAFAQGCAFLHPYHELLTAEAVAGWGRDGWRINTWTVNDRARMDELLGWGVWGLITDYPDRGRAAVAAFRGT